QIGVGRAPSQGMKLFNVISGLSLRTTPTLRLRIVRRSASCLDDGAIPRATAEIPRKSGDHVLALRCLSLEIQSKQRHHKSRSTEAALRAVAIHHRSLHGMQLAVSSLQALHRDQLFAIDSRQKADAGIDRPVLDALTARSQLPQNNRTRAA